MRAWIFVLAVLATFQVIVQVASTDSVAAKMESQQLSSSSKSKSQQQHRHRISSSPVLSFAAIVASAEKSSPQQQQDGQFSLTNSNNIVLNSDNVQHPAHETNSVLTEQQVQLLVPTNFKSSSPSANSVVNKSNISNSSGNSNSIDTSSVASGKRRHRTRVQRARRRRQRQRQRLQMSQDLVESSLQRSSQEQKRINSNELNVEDEEQENVTVEKEERAKPDPETLVTIEKNLLSLFGFKKRPSIDRSKVVIPEAMRRMYAETTGMELDLPDLPKPAIHRAHYTANTVRSFTHEGESSGFNCEIILRTANCCSESWG